jgi:hypothetical protein
MEMLSKIEPLGERKQSELLAGPLQYLDSPFFFYFFLHLILPILGSGPKRPNPLQYLDSPFFFYFFLHLILPILGSGPKRPTFWDDKNEHMCNNVRIQLPVGLKRKFLFSHLREN